MCSLHCRTASTRYLVPGASARYQVQGDSYQCRYQHKVHQVQYLEDGQGAGQVALLEILLDQPNHISRLDLDRHRGSRNLASATIDDVYNTPDSLAVMSDHCVTSVT